MGSLADFIDPYRLKRLLIIAIIAMLFIVLSLLIALVAHKIYVEFREKRFKRLKEMYIALISRKLIEPDFRINPQNAKAHIEAFGDVIADMLASISGEMEERIKNIVRESGAAEYYRQKAISFSWVARFRAVEKLGFLRLPEMKPFFHYLLKNEKDNDISARIIVALSFIAEDKEDIALINNVLGNPMFMSSKFNEYIYTNILKSFRQKGNDEIFLQMLEALRDDPSVPIALKKDIIEACGSEMFYPAKGIITIYYKQFDAVPAMKIACIRALGRLGGDDVCSMMEKSLADGDWRVRATAAKNAHLCADEIISSLRRSLRDKNYYVRINAAVSLSKLGEKGLSSLQDEVHSKDRFTSDVSRYILNEVRYRA